MQHPHFVLRALAQLGYLGAGDQLELFDVDWTQIKAQGEPIYRVALLAESQGKRLGMPQETIDEAIRLLLGKHEGLNMFRSLFGFYPLDETRRKAEHAIIKADKPTVARWYDVQLLMYAGKRAELLRAMAKQVVTASELDKIAKAAKWSPQQVTDALAGKNIYQIKSEPIPWLYIAMAMAAGVGLAYWWYRR
ncbi:hypothetical protein LCGC14_0784510 [marine sediment metagenome]|uniref:Uncharacterized protein n=1 Tax=marine sediment metagenome TaxID=412755 RepID=A0A0F9QEB5_9ZZZZ|nr:hypothetical protein [Phycisphaerae bacterium]